MENGVRLHHGLAGSKAGQAMRNATAAVTACLLLAGCATAEVVRFQPSPKQQAMMRDGNPALVSRQPNSVVLFKPASRSFASNGRPSFIVGMNNIGRSAVDFTMASVTATQLDGPQQAELHVFTYDELAREERNRQIVAAVFTGIAAGANGYSAARYGGSYSANSTVYNNRGAVATVTTRGYDPVAGQIAQQNAAMQNEAMIAANIEQGQQNMARLEGTILKDNTLLPGEWYGGQIQLQAIRSDGRKLYGISLLVGADRHDIRIEQGAP